MPLYEYRCEACDGTFSILQKMGTGASETTCPACGSSKVAKLISACSIGASGGMSTPSPACSGGGG